MFIQEIISLEAYLPEVLFGAALAHHQIGVAQILQHPSVLLGQNVLLHPQIRNKYVTPQKKRKRNL